MKDKKHIQSFNEHQENLNIKTIDNILKLKTIDNFYLNYSDEQIQKFLDYYRGKIIDRVNELENNESIEAFIYMPRLGYSKSVIITNIQGSLEVISSVSKNVKNIPTYDISYNELISGLISAYDGKTNLEHLVDRQFHIEIEKFIKTFGG
jgi:hypothetical protein